MLKTKIIVNPVCAHRAGVDLGRRIQEFLDAHDAPYSIENIYRAGGGTLLAKLAVEKGFEQVIVVGGDGTVNEVVNGMAESNLLLGIIPAGNRNSIAQALSFSADIDTAGQMIMSSNSHKIDLGKMNDRYFVGGVDIGFDTLILRRIGKASSWLSYASALLRARMGHKEQKAFINFEGNSLSSRVLLASIANAPTFGGDFQLSPEARLDDGTLNAAIISNLEKFKIFWHLPGALKGNILPNTFTFLTKKMSLESPLPLNCQLDGELINPSHNFRIELFSRKLSVKTL